MVRFQISSNHLLNFIEQTDKTKSACKGRWKCIRDSYTKLTKSKGKIKTSRSPLMKYLKFLMDSLRDTDNPDYGTEDSLASKYNIDLLKEVKKYKVIYDKDNNKENRIIRSEAWDKIGATLNLPAHLLQKRWKSLRDRYVKMFKTATENGESKIDAKWEMIKYLSFLNDYIEPERRNKHEIPADCEPIEVEVTEITYGSDFDDTSLMTSVAEITISQSPDHDMKIY